MKRRVIIDLPKGQSGLEVKLKGLRAGLGFNANKLPWPIMAGEMSAPDIEVNSTLKPVPRSEANLEAEKGEVAALPTKSGIPDTFKIGGKRHHSGGTPLNLPSDSFIFSDTAKMKIKDVTILAQFGLPERKGGYTPAEIAKKYDVNSFKKVLADPDTDKLQKQTAEMMIANYNLKLAKLALVQESMKGFPQGIPMIAMPYIEEMGIDPAQFVQMNPGGAQDEQAQTEQGEMDDVGAEAQGRFGGYMRDGGYIDYFADGGFKTQAEYEASLLQPYSPEKKRKQIEWLREHPSTRKLPISPPAPEVSTPTHPILTTGLSPTDRYNLYQNAKKLSFDSPNIDKEGLFNEDERRNMFMRNINDPTETYMPGYNMYSMPYTKSQPVFSERATKNTPKYTGDNIIPGFGANIMELGPEEHAYFLKKQKEFQTDAETKDFFQAYIDALNSENPAKMEEQAAKFDEVNIPKSYGWLPESDQDQLQDFSGILREQATKIKAPKNPSKYKEETNDADYAKKAETVYAELSRAYNKPGISASEKVDLKNKMNKAFAQTTAYKNMPSTFKRNQWAKPLLDAMEDSQPFSFSSTYSPKDATMYSDEDKTWITTEYDKLQAKPAVQDAGKNTENQLDPEKLKKAKDELTGNAQSKSAAEDYEQIFNY